MRQRGKLSPLKGWFKWLTRQNVLPSNPASELELPRMARRLPRHVLTVEEVEAVMAQVDLADPLGIRDRAVLETVYSTGMRRMEFVDLKVDDLDAERGTVLVRSGKGGKDRLIPIGERASRWIHRYLQDARPQLVVPPDDRTLFLTRTGEAFNHHNAAGQAVTVVQGSPGGNVETRSYFAAALDGQDNSQHAQHFFFANGQLIGSFGQLQGGDGKFEANFDVNFTPVSSQYPASAPSQVITQRGDTLQIVAARVFGDANLWYLIAQENGLTDPSAVLTEGTVLRIPNQVVSLANSADSFKPFDAAAVIQDVTSTQPAIAMPQFGGCGVVGQILLIAIVVLVAVYTAGVVSTAMAGAVDYGAGAFTAGSAVFSGTSGSASAAFVAGAAGGAAGSATSQGVGIAVGLQDEFDWNALGIAALASGVSASLGNSQIFRNARVASQGDQYAVAAIYAASGSAITQGVSVALGLQRSFSWNEVAISAVSAPVASYSSKFGGDVASSITGSLVRRAFGGKVDAASVLVDVFGNTLGNSLVSASSGVELSREQKRQTYGDLDEATRSSMAEFDDQLQGDLTLDLAMRQSNSEFDIQLQDDLDRGLARMNLAAEAAQQSRMFARELDESIRSNDLSNSLNRTVANMRPPQFEIEPDPAIPVSLGFNFDRVKYHSPLLDPLYNLPTNLYNPNGSRQFVGAPNAYWEREQARQEVFMHYYDPQSASTPAMGYARLLSGGDPAAMAAAGEAGRNLDLAVSEAS